MKSHFKPINKSSIVANVKWLLEWSLPTKLSDPSTFLWGKSSEIYQYTSYSIGFGVERETNIT